MNRAVLVIIAGTVLLAIALALMAVLDTPILAYVVMALLAVVLFAREVALHGGRGLLRNAAIVLVIVAAAFLVERLT